jgi:hypothetical protein
VCTEGVGVSQAGQGMQNTDFDGILACASRWNYNKHELRNEQSQHDTS